MPANPKPQHRVRGETLAELIKEAKSLPKQPIGTMCNLFQTATPNPARNGYSRAFPLDKNLYVQCFGECKLAETTCTLGLTMVRGSGVVLACNCDK